jgi:hypothetical protein
MYYVIMYLSSYFDMKGTKLGEFQNLTFLISHPILMQFFAK